MSTDIQIWPFFDGSGIFTFGSKSAVATIWKYSFLTSSGEYQIISNILNGYGLLRLSENQFFLLGANKYTSDLQMLKITFSTTSVNWVNTLTCSSLPWTAFYSESLLSTDSSAIYSLFIYRISSVAYLYFASLDAFSGNVIGSRYKSDNSVGNVYGSALNGNYIIW